MLLIIAVVLRLVEEYRNLVSAAQLLEGASGRVRVRRCGRALTLDITLVVPGDVAELAAGELVPGDVRLLAANSLHVGYGPGTGLG